MGSNRASTVASMVMRGEGVEVINENKLLLGILDKFNVCIYIISKVDLSLSLSLSLSPPPSLALLEHRKELCSAMTM